MYKNKTVKAFLCIALTALVLGVVLALTQKNGSFLAEFSAWLLLLAALAFIGFMVSYVLHKLSGISNGAPRFKSGASRPGRLELSKGMLISLLETFIGSTRPSNLDVRMIAYILKNGDCQPAVVISKSPFLVAAYSEDMDCVAMLRFPDRLAEMFVLTQGSKLVSSNFYQQGKYYARDLLRPAGRRTVFSNMHPVIADFLTDDAKKLESIKNSIPTADWMRTYELGQEYIAQLPGISRTGDPRNTFKPAKSLT